jgi:uncharacterized protein (TIGR00645 family)
MRRGLNLVLGSTFSVCRWAMAPLSVGLAAALAILLVQFFRELAHLAADFSGMDGAAVIIAVLKLIDLVLIANLVLIIIGAAVGVLTAPQTPALDSPEPAGFAGFGAIKLKLFAAVSAIAAIELLETFIKVDGAAARREALWEVVILLAFAVSGLLLALMDRLGSDGH